MRENVQARYFNRIYLWLFIATFAVCLPSLAVYSYARFTGSLPAAEVWEKRGGNHGPWWNELQDTLIGYSFLAMLALSFITLIFALISGLEMKRRKLIVFSQFVALAVFQLIIVYVMLSFLLWTLGTLD